MLEKYTKRLLEELSKKPNFIDRLFSKMSIVAVMAMGVVLMTVPARDFFISHKTVELTIEQLRDYQNLVTTSEDAAVVAAAHVLLKRDDVAGVWLRRGSVEQPELQLDLKKPEVSFSVAPFHKIGEYRIEVGYRVDPASGWSELRHFHAMLSFMAGLFIVLFTVLQFLEVLQPKAQKQQAGKIAPPSPPAPRGPDPMEPEPTPPEENLDKATEAVTGKSGLRLVK